MATDRRVNIVVRALVYPESGIVARPVEKAAAERVLAALDADLADPDTEDRMVDAAADASSGQIVYSGAIRAALAAWRGE